MDRDSELADVLAELRRREPIFHRAEFGTTRADFERMTTDDFWEVGASGRRYSKAYALDELEKRHATPHADEWETMDFQCRKLGEDVYLLTYTLLQTLPRPDLDRSDLVQPDLDRPDKKRRTRRSTIWHRTEAGWRIVYHQGTIVQDAE